MSLPLSAESGRLATAIKFFGNKYYPVTGALNLPKTNTTGFDIS